MTLVFNISEILEELTKVTIFSPVKTRSSYYDLVYEVTRKIPFGRVSTYGAIADYLALGSARMVGWALTQCNRTGNGDIPAHRVVNRKGELSGRNHFSSPTMMEELLRNEGIKIKKDQVEEFDQLFWHPGEHLEALPEK